MIVPSSELLCDGVDVPHVAGRVGGDDRIAQAVQGDLKTLEAFRQLPALVLFGLKVLFVAIGELLVIHGG